MKKITLFIFGSFVLGHLSSAQTKLLTMEEAVVKQRSTLAPAKLKQLMWVKGSDNYSFVTTNETQEVLVTSGTKNNSLTTIVSLSKLNEALTEAGQKTIKSFPSIQWKNEKQFTFFVLSLLFKIKHILFSKFCFNIRLYFSLNIIPFESLGN
jgi:hypothetical protein